jgi:heat shock protein HtpX
VKRRPVGRKASLTLRMAFVLLAVLALYAAVVVAVVWVAGHGTGWAIGVAVVGFVLMTALVSQLSGSGGFYFRALIIDVEPASPELNTRLERLAAPADMKAPLLLVATSDDANAFTVGVRRKNAAIVVTTALYYELDDNELDAVLAHELSHVANHDAAVMSFANVPRTLGFLVAVGPSDGDISDMFWFFIWPFGVPLIVLGSLVTLALSRAREYAADRGAAVLTGRPEALMSALEKLDGRSSPGTDLRTVQALCIVPPSLPRFELLMDHPPLDKRIAALAEIARDLGEPVRS